MHPATDEISAARPAGAPEFNREIGPPVELGLPYWFHLFFPDRALTTNLKILVIGCEDELALQVARANPRARITAVETRPGEREKTERAGQQGNVANLELAPEWPAPPAANEGFDLIYYNAQAWPGERPESVLKRAAGLLRPEGSIHVTLRARHAWTGVRAVRELLGRLGIRPDAEGYPRARQVVAALGDDHPWNLLRPEWEARPEHLLADWLGPEDPCFSVPEVYELLDAGGLAMQRFTYQSYYLPQCSQLAKTALLGEVRRLSPERQQALMELYWPGIRNHFAIACRADRPARSYQIDFRGGDWLLYAPLLPARLPLEQTDSEVEGKARLCWRAAGMPELGVSLGGFQYRLLGALDRAEELGDVVGVAGLSGDPQLRDEWAGDFFQLMWDYDFLHFRICHSPRDTVDAVAQPVVSADLAQQTRSELKQLSLAQADDRAAEPATNGEGTEASQRESWTVDAPFPEGPLADPAAREAEPKSWKAHEPEPDPEEALPADESEEFAVSTDNTTEAPAGEVVIGAEEPPKRAESSHLGPSAEVALPDGLPLAETALFDEAEALVLPERVLFEGCPLCGEPGFESLREVEAKFPDGGGVAQAVIPWMRCSRCAHVFAAGYFAGEGWRRILETALSLRTDLGQAVARRGQASRIVTTVTTLRERASGRWLDAGCSQNAIVAMAAEFGYDSVGLDCRGEVVKQWRALGYQVRAGSLFDCQDRPFDVISLSGLLDQMPFPLEALRHAHRLLGPRGLVFLSTPNGDSLQWRVLDREGTNPYWARLGCYHVFHRASMFRLLHEAGFEPCSYGAGEPEGVGMEVIACKR